MKAFPITDTHEVTTYEGMDLRDYFAAKVLQAVESRHDFDSVSTEAVAMRCYQIADAMMKARDAR